MTEYIVRETGYPGTLKQEIVGELVRCGGCRWYEINKLKKDGTEDRRCKPDFCALHSRKFPDDYFCADGKRKEDEIN